MLQTTRHDCNTESKFSNAQVAYASQCAVRLQHAVRKKVYIVTIAVHASSTQPPQSKAHHTVTIVSLKCRAQDSAVSSKAHHQPIFISRLSGVCATAGIAISTCKLDHPDVHFDSLQEVIHLLHNHVLSADDPNCEHIAYTHQPQMAGQRFVAEDKATEQRLHAA